MKIALLSNVTVDLLAGMLRKKHEVYLTAGFDTWQQEMMMSGSGLDAFAPDCVVILLHAGACQEAWNSVETGCAMMDEWCDTIRNYASGHPGIPVFVSSLDIASEKCRYGAEKQTDQFFEHYLIEQIGVLYDAGNKVYILPVKDLISEMGRSVFYSPKMWYVGSMPYSLKGMAALNELMDRYASAAKGTKKKKCLAVDLDNTLWGGVIGEDGVNGIVLSDHNEGARFRDTQRLLKKMKDQGVMLAILSKNNPDDVEPVYQHPHMVLQHEDFVAEVINWEPKTVSIRKLASDLNIGLDAFVFLDDNPAEREQMKAECPEVTVIEFPKDTSLLPETVAKAYDDWFFSLEVTGEDTQKTAMYRAESQRKLERESAGSVEDYLKRLEMTMEIHLMKPEEEARVVQLVNKTNQFNVTTRRYSAEEIHRLAEDGDIITVHMSDKYGDQGLTAVMILKYTNSTAEIDTFLMSCRVMGRKAEEEIMAQVKRYLTGKGIFQVTATYIRTAKNAPVADLFDRLGFTPAFGKPNGAEKVYRALTRELPESTGVFKNVNTEGLA